MLAVLVILPLAIVLALLAAFVLAQLKLGGLFSRTPAWVIGLLIGIPFATLILLFQRFEKRRSQRRVMRSFADGTDIAVSELIDSQLKPLVRRGLLGTSNLKGAVAGLIRCGVRDLTVHGANPKFAVPIHPIEIPFEPLPLDQTVPFVSLLGDAKEQVLEDRTTAIKRESTHDDRAETRGELEFRRRLARSVTLLGGRWMYGAFLVVWAYFAIEALIAWRVDWTLLLWTGVIAFQSFGIGSGGAWRSGQQWLIVPGGLVARKANRRGGWSLHLFERMNSVMVVFRLATSQVLICVADKQQDQTAVVTPIESIALLRAWLSPLPPPSVDQLAELAG